MFNATVRVKEWQGDVVFLHEVLPGSADRSYGIQVAKLAGLPPPVIARAKSVLAKLEAQDRGQTARALADDLPLFAVPLAPPPKPAPPSEAEQLIEAREGAASRRDVAARGAGGAVCAEGETAEAVGCPSAEDGAQRIRSAHRHSRVRCRAIALAMTGHHAPASAARSTTGQIPADADRQRQAEADRRAELQRGDMQHGDGDAQAPSSPRRCWRARQRSAEPPMRGCRISIMEVNTIGNSAMMPLIFGPTQPDSRDHRRHQRRDQRGPQRNVVPAAGDQRHLDVTVAPQAAARRSQTQWRSTIRPPASVQCTERMIEASTIHTATAARQLTTRAVALRQHDIGQPAERSSRR